jgi:hypothetical protein
MPKGVTYEALFEFLNLRNLLLTYDGEDFFRKFLVGVNMLMEQ